MTAKHFELLLKLLTSAYSDQSSNILNHSQNRPTGDRQIKIKIWQSQGSIQAYIQKQPITSSFSVFFQVKGAINKTTIIQY